MNRYWKKQVCSILLCGALLMAGALGAVSGTPVMAAELEAGAVKETETGEPELPIPESQTTETQTPETQAPETEIPEEPETPAAITALDTPTGLTVKAQAGRNLVSWDPVENATYYTVYREDSDSAMAPLVDGERITGTSMEDVDLLPGRSYIYQVRAFYEEGETQIRSRYSQPVTVVATIPPVSLGSVSLTANGVVVKWNAMRNVDGYYVVRKTGSGSYTTVATIKSPSTLSWTDTKTVMGQTYTYSVRGYVNDAGTIRKGQYSSAGMSLTIQIPGPVLKTAVPAAGQITVTWTKVSDAIRYYVYRKDAVNTSLKNMGSVTGLSFVDKTVVPGTQYTYTVKAQVSQNGTKSYTAYDKEGISAISVLDNPKLTGAKAAQDHSITVTWQPVTGADGYRVYRKTPGSGWVKLKDQTGLTYVDKDTQVGGNYTYTIRAYHKDGTVYRWSGYDKTGLTAKIALTRPVIRSTSAYSGGVLVNWTPAEDVDGYQVYRAVGTSGYTRIASVHSGSQDFYWNRGGSYAPKAGTTYTYAVRAYKIVDGAVSYSAASYMTSSVVARPEEPQVVSASPQGKKDVIVWSTVSGAEKYRIQYRIPGGSWTNETDAAGKAVNITASTGSLQQRSLDAKPAGTLYRVRAYAGGVWNTDMLNSLSNAPGEYTASKILFVGDSITFGQTWNGASVASPLRFTDRVEQRTGSTVLNTGRPGLRAIDVLGNESSLGLTGTGYDVVVVALGTNDYNRSTSMERFVSAMETVFNNIEKYSPEAKIVVITPLYRGFQYNVMGRTESNGEVSVYDYSKPGMDVPNSKGYTLNDYQAAMVNLAGERGAYVYNSMKQGVVTAQNYRYRLVDGLHPTVETYGMLGDSISEFLENGILIPDRYKE